MTHSIGDRGHWLVCAICVFSDEVSVPLLFGAWFWFLDISLAPQPRLSSNLQAPLCFSLLHAEIRGLHCHIQRPSDLLCFLTGLFVFLCCKKSLSIVILKLYLFMLLYMWLLCVCVPCVCLVPVEVRRWHWIPKTRVTDDCKPPCGC